MEDRTNLPYGVLAAEVEGLNLEGKTLGDQLTDQSTLLVFLRHLG
jgi:hypothetical protein